MRALFSIVVTFGCGFAKGAGMITGTWQIPTVVGLGIFFSALSLYPKKSEQGAKANVASVANAAIACPLLSNELNAPVAAAYKEKPAAVSAIKKGATQKRDAEVSDLLS